MKSNSLKVKLCVICLLAIFALTACAQAPASSTAAPDTSTPAPVTEVPADNAAESDAEKEDEVVLNTPTVVEGIAIPDYTLSINGITLDRYFLLDYPMYSVNAEVDGEVANYYGYLLSDIIGAVGLSGDYRTITCTSEDGDVVEISKDDALAGKTMVVLYKNGTRFNSVRCSSVSYPSFMSCGENPIYMERIGTFVAEGAITAMLPDSQPDPDTQFGTDKNVNIHTIDQWLEREDVVYRDMRMILDPATYEDIGGDATLSATLKGFQIVPYPYLGTLQELPVADPYTGPTLFDVVWNENGEVESVSANYAESLQVLIDLFPTDKPILLMCGGGGYAAMTKSLLTYLGWDEDLLYNIGGHWEYEGMNNVHLLLKPTDYEALDVFATWRVDYALIDFELLHESPDGVPIYSYEEYSLSESCMSAKDNY